MALLVLALAAGCERNPAPSQEPAQGPSPAPAVTTRGPDDAALTTADVTRAPGAPPAAVPLEASWREVLSGGDEAVLTLPADQASSDLPPEAAAQLDALARLLDSERDWRLSISVEEGDPPPVDGGPDALQRAQAFRLALLARGVAGPRLRAMPATRPQTAPPPGTVRVRLRRLPVSGRPLPASQGWG